MNTITYCQTPRPWRQIPVSTEPPAVSTVWTVTLTPENRVGEPIRRLPANARYAEVLAQMPACLGASWSRGSVNAVFDLEGGEDAALGLAFTRVRGVGVVGAFATDDPGEWDWLHPSTERLAREALGARHQCQPHDFCLCLCRGTEWSESRIVERGFLLGAGARL